jgi:hypothetical protein
MEKTFESGEVYERRTFLKVIAGVSAMAIIVESSVGASDSRYESHLQGSQTQSFWLGSTELPKGYESCCSRSSTFLLVV